MEPTAAPTVLGYQSSGRRGSWRMRALIALLLMAAAITNWRWYGRTAWENLRILYWQRECSMFQPMAGSFASTAICWTKYRTALPANKPFMGGTQIFLHECVSPHGSRLLVALYMRSNKDHMQLCSIDATVVVPATFSRAPTESRNVVAWIRGWSDAVQWDKLGCSQLDPADSSHIIFNYNSPEPKWWGSDNIDTNDSTMITTPMRPGFLVAG